MGLLRVGKVKRVVHREVARAGSQVGWAKRVGARPSDVSKTLNGKRLPVRSILDGVALRKVPAYRQKQPPTSRRLLHASEVVDLMKEEIRRAGNQSGWARKIDARQPDVNNALRGRRLPVKAILDALGLEKVVAYEGRQPIEPVVAGARIPSAESREMAQGHPALSREALR